MSKNKTDPKKTRVLIVDDHVLIRKGLQSFLEEIEGVEIIGEAADGETAIELVKTREPDVVFMDIDMPGIDGIEATKTIKQLSPDVEILVLTSCTDGPTPMKILQAGAKGYLAKGASYDEIKIALSKVRNHQTYVMPELAQEIAVQNLSPDHTTPFNKLSERELTVAKLVSRGEKVADIASKLELNSKTVNSYRYRIFNKLKIDSDVVLTRLAMKYDLVKGK